MAKFIKCGAFWKNEKGTGYSGKIEKDKLPEDGRVLMFQNKNKKDKQPDIDIGYYPKEDKSDF
jgi:hypothetical protein